jgi:HAD superfamily hydrolase (TIGR01459 family)
MPIAHLPGVAVFLGRYDAAIVDLWGVIHDGVQPYPAVPDALKRLKAAGIRVVLLSNAPRRADRVVGMLERMGIARDAYFDILTSGEIAHRTMAERARDPNTRREIFYIGPARDEALLDDLGYVRVPTMAEAGSILCTGPTNDELQTAADFAPEIAEGVARKLPFLCANPDLTVMRQEREIVCAGAIALAYEQAGGVVEWFGKPHPPAYQACFALLPGMERARIVCIGDSLRTDIAGADRMNLDSILIPGGIHAGELGIGTDGRPEEAKLDAACARARIRPTFVMPAFRW